MKKTNWRAASVLLALCIALTSVFGLYSCSSPASETKNSYSGITSARLNERGELIVSYSDGREQNLGAVSNEGTTINIENQDSSIASATSKGLASAVSITANFEKTYQNSYGGFFPGFGSGGTTTTPYTAEGSGVIYKLDRDTGSAFIITNYHVVYDKSSDAKDGISENIQVFLYGGEEEGYAIPAEYVGGSLYYDIAVLYVENCAALKNSAHNAPVIADSENVAVGTTAIAIGNPEGYGISASLGIVSVNSEYIAMTAADGASTVSFRVMRVDTAVNSGNSGGGLYNDRGELIGIVNAKIVDSTVENIGYAIPSNVASAVADNIIDNCFGKDSKSVMRAVLGVTLTSSDSIAVIDGELGMIKVKETVSVAEVVAGSVADGKLMVGDVLKSATLGDATVEITRRHHVIDLMLDARVGDVVKLSVVRDGKEMTVEITVTEAAIIAY